MFYHLEYLRFQENFRLYNKGKREGVRRTRPTPNFRLKKKKKKGAIFIPEAISFGRVEIPSL